jgi:L-seryl-tRNA(Ser) seleniumtransferase
MRQSGADLVEVGTTNRTYLRDYEQSVTDRTVAIMRVHASNFRVVGFTAAPSLRDMARIAREHDMLLIDDIGSGCLLDTAQFGLAAEPMVQGSIADGADLCLFSGDKLLGGPQAGIIAGRRNLVHQLARHPLARAVRLDKASIAGLHATFLHYLRGDALTKVPVWQMISASLSEIERRARKWRQALQTGTVVEGRSMIGGGSLPEESLPTRLLSIQGDDAGDLARRLRLGDPPVVTRVQDGAVLIDPRTVLPEQDKALRVAVKNAIG